MKIQRIISLLLAVALLLGATGALSGVAVDSATAFPVSKNAVLRYSYALKASEDWATCLSDALSVNGCTCIAAGDKLLFLAEDGSAERIVTLPSLIGFNCRLMLAENKIIVPLGDASVVAVDAESGEIAWMSQPVLTEEENTGKTQYHSIQATVAYDGENLYVPTVCFNAEYLAVRGELCCISAQTGARVWQADHTQGGFYWSGAVVRDGYAVIAATDGIGVWNVESGALADFREIPAEINAEIVYGGGNYYTVSKDGLLIKFTVDAAGKISEPKTCKFAYSSTCTPVICGEVAYVGGAYALSENWETPAAGVIARINTEKMETMQIQQTAAEVKAKPLVVPDISAETQEAFAAQQPGESVYFTCNAYPGGLYMWDGVNAPETVFTPQTALQNYCIFSPICDKHGNVLFANDAGTLFCIGAGEVKENVKGDANGDGKVTAADARIVLRVCARIDPAPENIVTLADLSGDGRVTAADARLILRIAAHLDVAARNG